MAYNPFYTNGEQFYRYMAYKSEEPEKLTIKNDLFDQFELPGNYGYNPVTGNVLAPANTPEVKEYDWSEMNRLGETHKDPDQEFNQNRSVKQDLQGSKKRAMEFFKSKKDSNGKQILTDYQIAGIVGNLMGESKLNAKAVNPTSGAFGYAQWLGDRKKKLFAKYGNNPTEEQQLEFIWEELNTSEKRAFEELLQTKTVDGAINSFMRHFERPSQKEMAQSIRNRLKYGRELLS